MKEREYLILRRVFYRCLLWLTILICGVSLIPRGSAEVFLPELASEAAVLMDAETGQIDRKSVV